MTEPNFKTWIVEYLARHGTALAVGNGFDSEGSDDPDLATWIADGQARNAIIHTHVSSTWTNAFGVGYAEWLGDMKERHGQSDPADLYKDQFNNKVGRDIGVWMATNGYTLGAYSLAELEDVRDALVMDAFNNGHLIVDATALDGNGIDTRITNELSPTWTGPSTGWESASLGRDYDHEIPGTNISDQFLPADWLNDIPAPLDNPLGETPELPPIPREKPPIPGWLPDVYSPFNEGQQAASPLIIDLDNDDVEATAFNTSMTETFFDIDGDGFREQTAWVGADDGLLVRDLNANGLIDNSSELFGSATVDGFALLANLDTNGDHVIDANDADFSDLMIWKDANGDAYVQSGEVQSLSYWNIESISLAQITAGSGTINGNPVSHSSTVTLTSGSTRAIKDVWFVHDNINSYYDGDYELDLRTLFLPNLRGFGEMADLHIAMSQDEGLLEMVQELTANWSMSSFDPDEDATEAVEAILLRWAGVDGVDPYSRSYDNGAYVVIDSRHLAFLEQFLGEDYYNPANLTDTPWQRAYQILQVGWFAALDQMKAQLFAQMGANALFDGEVTYNVWTGELEGDLTLSQAAIDNLVALSTDTGVDTEAYWRSVANFIDHTTGISNLTVTEIGWLDDAIYDSDALLTWDDVKVHIDPSGVITYGTGGADTITGTDYNDELYGDGGNDLITGGDGHDKIWGHNGDDTLIGNDGNDTIRGGDGLDNIKGGLGSNLLYGGNGNDSYYYEGGDDIIEEQAGTDKILLPDGITPEDVFVFRNNAIPTDMFVSVAGMGTIQITFQYYYYSTDYVVESIEFYDPLDGSISLSDPAIVVTYGSSGADTINGIRTTTSRADILYGFAGDDSIDAHTGDDIIDGGLGNDFIDSGEGNDTIIMSLGFDTLQDYSGTDQIVIPEAYSASDVHLMRMPDNYGLNLTIQVDGLGQLTVTYQFYGTYAIEKISFANGIDADILLNSVTIDSVGTNGADSMTGLSTGVSLDEVFYGYGGNDYVAAGYGNDTIWGGNGNDTLYGEDGNDIIYGEAGDDTVSGGDGNDTLYSGAGADTVTGGYGADTFVFEADSAFSAVDTIGDFSAAQGDAIDISDLLIGYDPLTSLITDFVEITASGPNGILKVDRDGTGSTYSLTQIATLYGGTSLTDEAALVSGGQLLVA